MCTIVQDQVGENNRVIFFCLERSRRSRKRYATKRYFGGSGCGQLVHTWTVCIWQNKDSEIDELLDRPEIQQLVLLRGEYFKILALSQAWEFFAHQNWAGRKASECLPSRSDNHAESVDHYQAKWGQSTSFSNRRYKSVGSRRCCFFAKPRSNFFSTNSCHKIGVGRDSLFWRIRRFLTSNTLRKLRIRI